MTAVVEPAVRRRGPLLALLVANVLSGCGTTMTFLAIPWFVLETTGSPVRTGLVLGFEVAGVVLTSVLGGPVIDRLGRRQVSVLSDVFAAAAVTAIPVLHLTVGLPFWALVTLTLLLGMSRAPGETARGALLPVLIGLAGTSTERAAGAYEGVSRTAKALGAPLGGVLIAVLGPPAPLIIDGGTFLISAALVVALVPGSGGERRSRSYLLELVSGFGYLRRDRLIGAVVLMVMVTNALDMGTAAVLFPVYAKDVLRSSVAYGLITGVFAGGAVLGNVLYSWLGARLRPWLTYTVAFLVCGAPRYFVLAAGPGLPVIVAWMLVAGLACGAINPILSVVIMRRVPAEQLPKVLGVIAGGALSVAPLGAVLGGVVVASFGLTATLLLVGGLYLLATLCPAMLPVWRQLDGL